MCPLCLTSLAVTVATTTGAGAAVTALAVRVVRSVQTDAPRARRASISTTTAKEAS
jgi:hypothetical protein